MMQSNALRNGQFRRFLVAVIVSRVGGMATPLILTFSVLKLGGGPSALSQVLGAQMLSQLVMLLGGGFLADRWPRRHILQITNLGSFIVLGVLALAFWSQRVNIPILVSCSALSGAVSAFGAPASQGIVSSLVPKGQLQSAVAWMGAIRTSVQLAGPLVGSVLVVATMPAVALGVDALSYLAASLLLRRISVDKPMRSRRGFGADVVAGFHAVTGVQWLWAIILGFTLMNALSAGVVMVIGPAAAVADAGVGVKGWSLALSASATGAFFASTILTKVQIRRPLVQGLVAMAGTAAFIYVAAAPPNLPVLMIAGFAMGIGLEVFNAGWNSCLLHYVESASLSKVISLDLLGSYIAMPLGVFLFGSTRPELYATVGATSAAAYIVVLTVLVSLKSVRLVRAEV